MAEVRGLAGVDQLLDLGRLQRQVDAADAVDGEFEDLGREL
ncbi:hypothetical protein [Tessaracoccus sp.]|nr:hypothetical protein [Tessaracoccus sp.]